MSKANLKKSSARCHHEPSSLVSRPELVQIFSTTITEPLVERQQPHQLACDASIQARTLMVRELFSIIRAAGCMPIGGTQP